MFDVRSSLDAPDSFAIRRENAPVRRGGDAGAILVRAARVASARVDRRIAWSVCGERLCDCTPTPECALCPAGDTVVCAVASTAPRKTDRSESRDLQQRIATMIGALVAISDTNAGSPAIAAPALPRGYGWAFDGSMPASRALAPAAPPPWA
jgi:hypothetical protein